jgi:pimeloyl-ACP methyl ester carboxylesterase
VDDVITAFEQGDDMTATTTDAPPRNGDYIDVDGVRTYYEVTGTGEPLILLHGGLCPAESWDAQTAALAEQYRVYVPERYGHGRTRDIDGPITYENMAQHTIALIEALGIESAHLAGWSDGALVGVLVALRRPELVRKLVYIDQYVTLEDAPPGLLPFLDGMSVETAPPPFVEMYRAFSPDGPDHFPVVLDKLRTLWTTATGVTLADLERVAAPTLVLAGDDGGMTLEHLSAVGRTLPDAQLAVVPGTSHGLVMEKPDVVNRLILDFLADAQAPKLFSFDE